MTSNPSRWSGKSSAASLAARFPAEARRLHISVEAVRDAYARDCFFRRLAISAWRDRFILKGSVLLVALLHQWHRPTQDADFLVLEAMDADTLRTVLVEVTSLPMDDEVVFDVTSLRLSAMQEDARMVGHRAIMKARLGKGRLVFRADVGFNDVVTPAPNLLTMDTVLSRPVTILGSTLFTAVAEKFDAMVDHGLANTRAKDFYDLALIARVAIVDGDRLVRAIRATFSNRGRILPTAWPAVLDEVANDAAHVQRYRQFLAQAGRGESADLRQAIAGIRAFMSEPLQCLDPARPFPFIWSPEQGWREP